MIALTGKEEQMLRDYRDLLDTKPPLVGMLRFAVRELIEKRLEEDPEKRAQWNKKHRHLKLVKR